MTLSNTYRIIHCQEYNGMRDISKEWWEVQCFKSKWWSFGNRWFTETNLRYGYDGTYNRETHFASEKEAFEYIGKVSRNVPKDIVVRTPVSSYI